MSVLLNQKVQELFSNATGGTACNCSIKLSYLPQKGKRAQLPLGNCVCSTLTPEHIHFERATACQGKTIRKYFKRLIFLRLISLTLKNLNICVGRIHPEALQHETLIHLLIPHLSISQRTPQGVSCNSNRSASPTRTNWNDTYRSTNRNVTPERTNRNDTLKKTSGLWPSFNFWCYHYSSWGNTVLQRQVSDFFSSNTFFWDSQRQNIKFSSRNLSSLGYKGRYFFLKVLRQLCKFVLAQQELSNMVYWQVSKMF